MLPNEACELSGLNGRARAGARSTLLDGLFELARASGSTDPVDKLDWVARSSQERATLAAFGRSRGLDRSSSTGFSTSLALSQSIDPANDNPNE